MGKDDQGDPKMVNEVLIAWQRAGLDPPPERITDFVKIYTRMQETLQLLQKQMDFGVQPAVSYGFPATYFESDDHDE